MSNSVEAEEVEEVTKLKYIRVTISRDGGCNDEIEQRIGQQQGWLGQ